MGARVVAIRDEETDEYHTYVTNIPLEELSAEEIAQLYGARWHVELVFKELKSRYALDVLPTKSVHVIEAYVWIRDPDAPRQPPHLPRRTPASGAPEDRPVRATALEHRLQGKRGSPTPVDPRACRHHAHDHGPRGRLHKSSTRPTRQPRATIRRLGALSDDAWASCTSRTRARSWPSDPAATRPRRPALRPTPVSPSAMATPVATGAPTPSAQADEQPTPGIGIVALVGSALAVALASARRRRV